MHSTHLGFTARKQRGALRGAPLRAPNRSTQPVALIQAAHLDDFVCTALINAHHGRSRGVIKGGREDGQLSQHAPLLQRQRRQHGAKHCAQAPTIHSGQLAAGRQPGHVQRGGKPGHILWRVAERSGEKGRVGAFPPPYTGYPGPEGEKSAIKWQRAF